MIILMNWMVGILSQHTCIANHQGILSISYNFITQLYLSRARKCVIELMAGRYGSNHDFVLIIYCYIIQYCQTSWLKQQQMFFSLTVWEVSSYQVCFWLRVSHEVAIKLLGRAADIWRLSWGWTVCFPGGSHGQKVGAGCPLPHGPHHVGISTVECPQDMATYEPLSRWHKRSRDKWQCPFWPTLKNHICHFHNI